MFVDPDGADLGDTKQKAVEEFSLKHPQVKVDRVFGEGGRAIDEIQTMLAGGTRLDLSWD